MSRAVCEKRATRHRHNVRWPASPRATGTGLLQLHCPPSSQGDVLCSVVCAPPDEQRSRRLQWMPPPSATPSTLPSMWHHLRPPPCRTPCLLSSLSFVIEARLGVRVYSCGDLDDPIDRGWTWGLGGETKTESTRPLCRYRACGAQQLPRNKGNEPASTLPRLIAATRALGLDGRPHFADTLAKGRHTLRLAAR